MSLRQKMDNSIKVLLKPGNSDFYKINKGEIYLDGIGGEMLFNSYDFMLFFPIVVAIYFIIPKKIRYIWLLIVSYYFYMGWNAKYAILIAVSTIITYLSGVFIERIDSNKEAKAVTEIMRYKKWVVVFSFATNIGILFFFKYFDFLWENIQFLFTQFGVTVIEKPFDVILPVGISFYTFQALSYTVDVYRGDVKAEKNILRYALFVSFFPQLVAGPIERSKNLLMQVDKVEEIHVWDYDRVTQGAVLMLWGLFQKMVIADRAAILVDTVYDSYWMYGSIELMLATVLFAVQIYCDFGSYSLIAIGAAKIMGFALMENFNTPYFSRSIKEFWRRWHISLSTWFRDYLYIPLGGNQCSKIRRYINLMITFLVSGLWHGASWSFICWGGVHGLYQVIGDMLRPVKKRLIKKYKVKDKSISYKLGQIFVTFVLVDFAWIFFRMNSLSNSLKFIWRIMINWNPWVLYNQSLYKLGLNQQEIHILIISIVILFLVDCVRYKKNMTLDIFLKNECIWFRWGVLFCIFFFIVIFGIYGPAFEAKQFIYFQF